MKNRSFLPLLLIVPVLLGSVAFMQRSAIAPSVAPQSPNAGGGSYTDFVVHGTAWQAEAPANFTVFKDFGWGTLTRAKAASTQSVHMPLAYTPTANLTIEMASGIQFCARSSNGAATKPVKMTAWFRDAVLWSTAIAWPADNLMHCINHNFAMPASYQDLGLSLALKFANSTDTIRLYEARLRMFP